MKKLLEEELKKRFTYHAPNAEQIDLYDEIRSDAHVFASYLASNIPDSRELSIALTKLEECVMWANAAVARNS